MIQHKWEVHGYQESKWRFADRKITSGSENKKWDDVGKVFVARKIKVAKYEN